MFSDLLRYAWTNDSLDHQPCYLFCRQVIFGSRPMCDKEWNIYLTKVVAERRSQDQSALFGALCHVGLVLEGMSIVLAPFTSRDLGIHMSGKTMFPVSGLKTQAVEL